MAAAETWQTRIKSSGGNCLLVSFVSLQVVDNLEVCCPYYPHNQAKLFLVYRLTLQPAWKFLFPILHRKCSFATKPSMVHLQPNHSLFGCKWAFRPMFWWQLNMSVDVFDRRIHSGPSCSVHVVPDVDDLSDDNSKECNGADGPPGSSQFETKLREASQLGSEAMPHAPTLPVSRTQRLMVDIDAFAPVLPIVHLGWDARPLTPAEVITHCQLFTPQTRATWWIYSRTVTSQMWSRWMKGCLIPQLFTFCIAALFGAHACWSYFLSFAVRLFVWIKIIECIRRPVYVAKLTPAALWYCGLAAFKARNIANNWWFYQAGHTTYKITLW